MSEWIKFEDKHPEKEQIVMIFWNVPFPCTYLGKSEDGKPILYPLPFGGTLLNSKFWMPVPPSPKEE